MAKGHPVYKCGCGVSLESLVLGPNENENEIEIPKMKCNCSCDKERTKKLDQDLGVFFFRIFCIRPSRGVILSCEGGVGNWAATPCLRNSPSSLGKCAFFAWLDLICVFAAFLSFSFPFPGSQLGELHLISKLSTRRRDGRYNGSGSEFQGFRVLRFQIRYSGPYFSTGRPPLACCCFCCD